MIKEITVAELREQLEKEASFTLLDVRTVEEIQELGQITNSDLVIDFYAVDFKEQLKKLDPTRVYLVYCKAGGRSLAACILMKEMNLTCINLAGGYTAWQQK